MLRHTKSIFCLLLHPIDYIVRHFGMAVKTGVYFFAVPYFAGYVRGNVFAAHCFCGSA